ncbi:MAG: hypothetical protein JSV80_14360 [Acidobacteriota bacterium]|nr:MAG: hypothetical protein JSV80_14360 [Acidobacteriota bacterium]
MKKVAKIVGLCSRPLQVRYLAASESERAALRELVEGESGWILGKMRSKGYELEATVGEIYGIFTRGPARGTIKLSEHSAVSS